MFLFVYLRIVCFVALRAKAVAEVSMRMLAYIFLETDPFAIFGPDLLAINANRQETVQRLHLIQSMLQSLVGLLQGMHRTLALFFEGSNQKSK